MVVPSQIIKIIVSMSVTHCHHTLLSASNDSHFDMVKDSI